MEFFRRDKCKQLIKYNDEGIEFTFGSKIDNFIPFVKIKVDKKKLEESCDVAKTLDNYLYRLCEIHKDANRDSDEYREYQIEHKRVLKMFSAFRLALSVPQDNSGNQENMVADSINNIREYLQEDKSIPIPNLSDDVNPLEPKLRQIHSNLKKYQMGMVVSVLALLIMFTATYFVILDDQQKTQDHVVEQKQLLIEKQTNTVRTVISHNIQSLIDSSGLTEASLLDRYEDYGKTIPEFVDFIDNDNDFGIYAKDFPHPYVSAYHHLMTSGPECRFIQYAYEKEPDTRHDGTSLESCDGMNNYDLLLLSALPSTGTTDFVIGLARNINFETNDNTSHDLIASVAMDLTNFSLDVKNSINSDDMRFVLADRKNQIVFDCERQECHVNYEDHATTLKSNNAFDEDSMPLEFNKNNYSDYDEADVIDFSKENDDLHIENNNNSQLLLGWKLYVFYK